MRKAFIPILLGMLPHSMAAQSSVPQTHELKASPSTIHIAFFDATLPPVLTVSSGDFINIETATGHPGYFESLGVPRDRIPPELYAVYDGVQGVARRDHTLTGPIAIEGAMPGDMLEVRILSVDVRLPIAGQGFGPTSGVLREEFPYANPRALWIDMEKRTVEYAPGVEVPIRPFWGIMAVAPPVSMGRVASTAPGVFGGNMDNKDLIEGTTLYLPVHVPGALLSIGDGHAAQGYGEVSGSAIETSLRGRIQVILHEDRRMGWPRAETPTHFMTMGLHEDLDEATKIATREMLNFLVDEKRLDRADAYLLASAAMDLMITQVVDGTKGVHAMMPKAVFTR